MIELQCGERRIEPGRLFCIGRNYADHARELGNAVPAEPVVFMKPAASLVGPDAGIEFPAHGRDLHLETELVALIGTDPRGTARIDGVSLGLDLTLRDVQSRLKSAGLPWELAKAFEQSAAVGRFATCEALPPLDDLRFECHVNDELRQRGHSADMLFPLAELVRFLGGIWRLAPGDLVFSGTPAGVGNLARGDRIVARAGGIGEFSWHIL